MTVAYKLHTAKEALKEPPPVKWIVNGILGEETLAVWYGEGGSKKTYSLIDQLVCIASGAKWLGHKTKQTKVLIVDQESGEIRLWRRIHEILCGHHIDSDIPLFYVCMPAFNLMKSEDTEHLKTLIKKVNAEVILIDALIDVMTGGDDNSSKDTAIIFHNVGTLVHSLHVSIEFIHHANRKGTFRGSSNIRNQVDLMIGVDSKQGSPNIDFESDKTRDSEAVKFSAVAHFAPNSFYLSQSGTSAHSTTEQYIIDMLDQDDCTMEQLEKNCPSEIKPSAIKPAMQKMIKNHLAVRSNPDEFIARYRLNGHVLEQ